MTRQAVTLCLLLAVVVTACSGNDQNNNSDPEDVGGDTVEDVLEDTEDDADEDAGDTDESDADDDGDTQCTPRTECEADECGTVDDGCGGTLECDTACNCIDGQPQGVVCGECGLGQYQCDSGETGEGTCVGPDLPGLDADSTDTECSSALVYVDPLSAIAGEGTRERPYTTYREGWENATAGQTLLLVSEATFSRRITVKDGVSVFGGFTHETWLFDPDMKAEFNAPVNNSDDTVGITAEGVTQDTILAYLSVATENETRGGSTYGLVAVDADALELRGVILKPGEGANGVAGRTGDDGQDGNDAAEGSTSLFPGVGSGRTNAACPEANGGDGGNGAKNPDGVTGTATPGAPAATGAPGGAAGMDGTTADKAGEDGTDGAPVTVTAADGIGGVFGGSIESARWTPSGMGEAGEDGPDGDGGGGGGGSWHGPQYCTEADGDAKYYAGVKGGPGASGGCGGNGGEGGQAGGASLAALLIRSDVTFSGAELFGDDGGDGGRGGGGGAGGLGGSASGRPPEIGRVNGSTCDPAEPDDSTQLGFTSGGGGGGSDGGPGGAGGGGAGGPSWGVYCVDSTPSIDDATTINAGAAGTGGPSNGNAGEDGVAAPLKDCP